jgi:predicted  nucleic acid-binding Zn-ribbon protein
MSSVPKTNKPKYNNSDAFRWVDAQWEKFMTEQKELKSKIEDLENEIEQLKQDFYFDMRNKNLEIKSIQGE